MKRYLFPIVLAFILCLCSCSNKTSSTEKTPPQFSNELMKKEKAGGIMTPEILWKFRRLGSFDLSPDRSAVTYTVTDIDMQTESGSTNIYKISSSGGVPVQLTTDGGSSPQWFNNSESIAYVKDGQLIIMNADGSEKMPIENMKDFESYRISPAGDKILFTRRVKLDETANEKHNLPKANVGIIDDLMYRHWNYWSDFSYSHIFIASFNGKKVADEKDIMEGQKYDSPSAPYFDEKEISWSPDGKEVHRGLLARAGLTAGIISSWLQRDIS